MFGVVSLACAPPAPEPLVAAIGAPTGDPTEVTIGPDGGELSAGALTVSIPAGALDRDTLVSATPISSTAPGARGQAFRLEPEGTAFAEPVTVTFTYGDDDLEGTSAEALLVAFQHGSGVWAIPVDVTVDAAGQQVSVETTHFSDWSMVAGAQLRPPSATVKTNGTLEVTARLCYGKAPDFDPELGSLRLGYGCDPDEDLAPVYPTIRSWSVNGVKGGDGTNGTIVGKLNTATFTAPGSKPSPATVAVSARIDFPPGGTALIVSNVTISEGSTILVEGRYERQDQPLTSFVTATVTDAFEFTMPWPLASGTYPVSNIPGGGAGDVADTRAGCITPTLDGAWDELLARSVIFSGVELVVEGDTVAPAITLGVGEGDCATMTRVEPAQTTEDALLVTLPVEFFTSETPPAKPLVATEGGWTLTYTTQL